MNYMVSSLTSVGSGLSGSINNIRQLLSSIRGFVADIIQQVFGVFLNMIVEFQKIILSIKDMVGKMIGIVVTIMYVLDGSIKTMNSAWSGPPGQMIKSMGSCFHPQTMLTLQDGTQCAMESVPVGTTLVDGGNVFAVLKVNNAKQEPLYNIRGVLVTGEHWIMKRPSVTPEWEQVKNCPDARKTDVILPYFSCLITTNRRIVVGECVFWDWEDDELFV